MRIALAPLALLAMGAPAAALAEEPVQKASETVSADAQQAAKIAAIQRHVDAYRSGDLDAFVATFAPDAVVRADGFVAMGREQIRALYELNFIPGAPQLKVHESGVKGENVFLSLGYVFEGGREMCCSYSEYEITNDGKVAFLETSSG
ncbi:hypothetical protein CD351_07415 [Erythrobacter sp. KY5]|uniref:nuclear transport factor 2 family protein n=1 Tax=Erythrobacter sp. KY5 TaxID=2011159 RepID=UPI000DBF357C|nr:nuclear transport factor 2 family protein [Erythrobacter sp. KY5]AWW74257.1 hypothetical protein CD351_07415 [Erythrobacter sp. KY5]